MRRSSFPFADWLGRRHVTKWFAQPGLGWTKPQNAGMRFTGFILLSQQHRERTSAFVGIIRTKKETKPDMNHRSIRRAPTASAISSGKRPPWERALAVKGLGAGFSRPFSPGCQANFVPTGPKQSRLLPHAFIRRLSFRRGKPAVPGFVSYPSSKRTDGFAAAG